MSIERNIVAIGGGGFGSGYGAISGTTGRARTNWVNNPRCSGGGYWRS